MRTRTRFGLGIVALVIAGAVGSQLPADRFVEFVRGPLGENEQDEVAVIDGPITYNSSAGSALAAGDVMRGVGKGRLRDVAADAPSSKAPAKEMPKPLGATGPAADIKLQSNKPTTSIATTGATGFAGMTLQSNGAGWPPDTVGDVGPTQYVQSVNSSVAVYSKTGTSAGAWTFNTFMQTAGMPASSICGSKNQGDPQVLFDETSGKWVVLDFAWSNLRQGPWYYCIAVSDGSDAASTWHSFQVMASSVAMADYPKMALSPSGLTITANLFRRASSYAGVQVMLLSRSTLFSTGAALKGFVWTLGTGYFSLLPVDVSSQTTGGLSTQVTGFLMSDYGNTGRMNIWRLPAVDFALSSAPALPAPTAVTVSPYTSWTARIAQKSSTETLDALGDRLMFPATLRDFDANSAYLYVARTASAGSAAGVRWYVFKATGAATTTYSVVQQSTYGPADGLNRWMPSLAVNGKGELAIGFSTSSSNAYPSIAVVGSSDPTTKSIDLGEFTIKDGTGSQSGGYNRWGDYSAMSVDPADKCTFWYTTEFYSVTGNNWQTWIAPVQLTNCP